MVVAALLISSAYSDLVSPVVWIFAAYLGLAFPVFLLSAILWTMLLLAARHWKLALFMLVCFIAISPRIQRYFPFRYSRPQPIVNTMTVGGKVTTTPVDTFRVLTFNTRGLGDAHLNLETEPLPVMDLVQESEADVVFLQEYAYSNRKNGHTEEKLRERVKEQYPYYHFLRNSNREFMGIVLYSKWPILTEVKIDTCSTDYTWAMYYEIDYRGRKLALVNCHLESTRLSNENRKLYKSQARHFESDSLARMEDGLRQLKPSFLERTRQTSIINRFLNTRMIASDKLPLLICGDLNDTPISFTYHSLRRDFGDAWVEAGYGPGTTYREIPFLFRIDHVFHSSHFHALRARVLKEIKASDHYPVMVDFQLLPDTD